MKTTIRRLLLANRTDCTEQQVSDLCALLKAIRAVFGFDIEDLKSAKRGEILSYARRVWFWFAKDILSGISVQKLAGTINKDGASARYSLRMFENDMIFNAKFKAYAERINDFLL
jgi:chromosomal replication initiation ATPase DnaA